nr:cytidine deaminase [uncultured Carboxylicivirga sp.]
MKNININTNITVFESQSELPVADQELVEAAKEACLKAYAPYSSFNVGAAIRLANGVIVKGNNQENAAYPSGLCAERVAMFYANSSYPDVAVVGIAVIAMNDDGVIKNPIAPCGSCRQVLLETELRMKQEFYTLLIGATEVYKIDSSAALLPLSFTGEGLKRKKP